MDYVYYLENLDILILNLILLVLIHKDVLKYGLIKILLSYNPKKIIFQYKLHN